MFIRLRELISVSCQSMAHIAIYVNLLQEPYVLSRYICKSTSRTICFEPIYFSNNYGKFAQRKLLLSSDVELNPGPSNMETVLSAIQARENKVLFK